MNNRKPMILSVITGVLAGILMGAIVLWMMIRTGFEIGSLMIAIEIIAVIAVPQCIRFVELQGLPVVPAQFIMVLTSFLITVFYGYYVSSASSAIVQVTNILPMVLKTSGLLHGCSLVSVLLFALIFRKS